MIIRAIWFRLSGNETLRMSDGHEAKFEAANYATLKQMLSQYGRWLPVGFALWIERLPHRPGDSLEARMPKWNLGIRVSFEEAR